MNPFDMLLPKKWKRGRQMPRTLEATVMEVTVLLLVLAEWVTTALLLVHGTENIPTHYDLKGNPDGWGSYVFILFPILGSLLPALYLYSAYSPDSEIVHLPVKVKSLRQCQLAARLHRIDGIIMAFLFLYINLTLYRPDMFPHVLVFVVAAILLLVVFIFSVMIRNAR